jgi:hypothetical protein
VFIRAPSSALALQWTLPLRDSKNKDVGRRIVSGVRLGTHGRLGTNVTAARMGVTDMARCVEFVELVLRRVVRSEIVITRWMSGCGARSGRPMPLWDALYEAA